MNRFLLLLVTGALTFGSAFPLVAAGDGNGGDGGDGGKNITENGDGVREKPPIDITPGDGSDSPRMAGAPILAYYDAENASMTFEFYIAIGLATATVSGPDGIVCDRSVDGDAPSDTVDLPPLGSGTYVITLTCPDGRYYTGDFSL